jgi:hypothetical protein
MGFVGAALDNVMTESFFSTPPDSMSASSNDSPLYAPASVTRTLPDR